MLSNEILKYPRVVGAAIGPLVLTVVSLVCLFAVLWPSPGVARIQQEFKAGVIVSRNLVRGPNDQPIFAEFDENGKVVRIIGEAFDDLEDAYVLSGDVFRALLEIFQDFKDENAEGIARGAKLLSREDYEDEDFGSAKIPASEVGGEPTLVAIHRPPLKPGTRSVYVRAANTIVTEGQANAGPILLESSINLRDAQFAGVGDNVKSVLINDKGQVVQQSELNIGYRVAFYKPDDDSFLSDASKDSNARRESGDTPWGPIGNARVYTTLAERFATTSGTDGRYAVRYYLPPCPGFTFEYSHHVIAELKYRIFNPRARQPLGTYYTAFPAFDFCNGLDQLPFPPTLSGQMTRLAISAIIATSATPIVRSDIRVDVVMLTGQGRVANQFGGALPLGETKYEFTRPPAALQSPSGQDLDLDRETDTLGAPEGGKVGVFFNGQPGGEDEPDLFRLQDYASDFTDRGLLTQISTDDLKETDLYIFRTSNGQLITERQGLKLDEYARSNNGGVAEDENKFFYKVLIRGPQNSDVFAGRFLAFQQRTQIEPELQGREADHLRVGEEVQLVAINRKTGYIGTSKANVGSGGQGSSRIDFPIQDLVLRPPNLKAKVQRVFKVEAGLTKDEEREHQIAFEGSGTTKDTYVALTTAWYDHDGTLLPEALPGYTGRLAKVVAQNSLGETGDVAPFDIEPGQHLQIVRLQGSALANEHFYLHVAGEPTDRDPDFSTGGAQGLLQYRPARYVPFKVAFLDERATTAQRQALAYAREDGLTDAESLPAVYRWHYRPEMQFSLVNLNVRTINRTELDDEITNLLAAASDSDPDTVVAIGATDQECCDRL